MQTNSCFYDHSVFLGLEVTLVQRQNVTETRWNNWLPFTLCSSEWFLFSSPAIRPRTSALLQAATGLLNSTRHRNLYTDSRLNHPSSIWFICVCLKLDLCWTFLMLSDVPTSPPTPQAHLPGGDDKQEEDQCDQREMLRCWSRNKPNTMKIFNGCKCAWLLWLRWTRAVSRWLQQMLQSCFHH